MFDFILTVIYCVLFLLLMHWIPFFRNSNIRFGWLILFFVLKVISGEFAWWLYSYVPYFKDSSDAFRYFTDGKFLYDGFFINKHSFFIMMTGGQITDPQSVTHYSQMISWNRVYESGWFNDNRFMIRFNAVLDFISFGNYHVNLLIANILSFTGLLQIYNFFNNFIEDKKKGWLVFSLFILPCLVFWGSILSKETLAIFSIGIIFTGIKKASWYRPGIFPFILILAGLLVLLAVKYYLMFLLLPLIIAYLLNEKEGCPTPANRYMTFISWFFTITMLINLFVPAFDPAYWLLQQQKNFYGFAHFHNISTPFMQMLESTSILGLFLKSPLALVSGLFGIYFPPDFNVWAMLAIFENTFILALIFWLLSSIVERIWTNNLVILFLLFFSMDLVIIGFTTPYAGAIHRYRIISFPLFLAAISCITARNSFSFLRHFHKPITNTFHG